MRTRHLLVMTLLMLAVGASSALGTAEQVIADHAHNGIIDGAYTTRELEGALVLAERIGGPNRDSAIRAIRDAERESLFGVSLARDATATAGSAASQTSDARATSPLNLPRAPAPPPGTSVPPAFIVLSVMAGLLMVGGAASTVIRRLETSSQRPSGRLGRH